MQLLGLIFCFFVLSFARLQPVEDGAPFQWDNCDTPTGNLVKYVIKLRLHTGKWVKIQNLAINPNPIKLGGMINVRASVIVGQVVSNASFTNVGLTLERKTLGVCM